MAPEGGDSCVAASMKRRYGRSAAYEKERGQERNVIRMKKRYLKVLPILSAAALCCQLLAGAVSPSRSAGETVGAYSSGTAAEYLAEQISLRSRNIKHFQISEGAYIAAVYGEPVHYQDDGGDWEEINNALTAVSLPAAALAAGTGPADVDAPGVVPYWENADNPFKVRMPETISPQTPVSVTYQGYTLAFCMQEAVQADAEIAPVRAVAQEQRATLRTDAADAGEEGDWERRDQLLQEAAMLLPEQKSSATYADVQPSTDITYEISGQKLKESFIFHTPPVRQSWSFRLHYTGLVSVVQPFGAVHFYAQGQEDEEPVFIIEAPYMADAGDSLSMDVAVSVTPAQGGCVYTITPDAAWLNDPARVYPVVLDPTVTTSTASADIEDAGVNESDPDKNYHTVDRMYAGSNLSGSAAMESRIYIRFPRVSAIPTSAYIHRATMYLDHYPTASYQTASNNLLDVYEVRSTDGWSASTLTWRKQAGFVFANRVCSVYTDKGNSLETFDITALMRKWYQTTASNNGLVVKPRTKDAAKTNRTCYISSDCGAASAAKRPRVSIEYYTGSAASGIDTSMWYHIQNVHSGKYLDVYNGGGANAATIQYSLNWNLNQQWELQYLGGGVYHIVPQHNTGLRLDVPNARDEDGLDLQVYTANASRAQLFRVIANGDGSYRIGPAYSSARVLDVESASTANSAPVQIWTWTGEPQMKWLFQEVEFGNGGEYRQVNSGDPNCFGYALFLNQAVNPKLSSIDSHTTEDFSDRFAAIINMYAVSCRRIASHTAPINSNEYRMAVRAPNGLDGIHNYHVIYQLSDGTWAGKDATAPSKHFGRTNPSTTPAMWSNNAYSPSAGTIYFAVRRW